MTTLILVIAALWALSGIAAIVKIARTDPQPAKDDPGAFLLVLLGACVLGPFAWKAVR